MNIHFLNDSRQGIGGGWSFMANLQKALTRHTDHKIAGTIADSDICFVSGVTMVSRQTIDAVQAAGKKLVVRLDNVPRNSRNRNTGTSRLIEFSNRADAVVWQCEWAKDYYGELIKTNPQKVIYNGIDQEIFRPDGPARNSGTEYPVYIYSRFNRDETKNWEVAWYEYQLIHKENPNAKLLLIGNFSPEQMEYNFDFFRGEKVEYVGVLHDPREMAAAMRSAQKFLAVYYNDCFSNTYLEALSCGMSLDKISMTGGTPEMLKLWENKGREYFGLERLGREYGDFFDEIK